MEWRTQVQNSLVAYPSQPPQASYLPSNFVQGNRSIKFGGVFSDHVIVYRTIPVFTPFTRNRLRALISSLKALLKWFIIFDHIYILSLDLHFGGYFYGIISFITKVFFYISFDHHCWISNTNKTEIQIFLFQSRICKMCVLYVSMVIYIYVLITIGLWRSPRTQLRPTP